MSHSAVGGWFLCVLIGAAKMRGQDKNNADISDYGGRWNHPEDRIFPSYLGMCNTHHISMQSQLVPLISPLLCQG